MRYNRELCRKYGVDEYGFPMIPVKYSNMKIARIMSGECPWDFPYHSCRNYDNKKSWKKYRKTQWR
jgi:hypothetical protein